MKILSLFDGMSCGMLAFLKSGTPVSEYVAFETDKFCIQTSKFNFPEIKQGGDVFNADFKQFEGFDFLIGGSPCTYWSIAQSKNRETEASGMGWELFSQYVRALHEAKPKYFIYENNKSMSKAIRDSIREAFGFEEVLINSALVSAQNRQRYYWVGKRNADGTYSKVDVQQPEDRGILLRDILNPKKSKQLSDREMQYMVRKTKDNRNHFDFGYIQDANKGKAMCITANISRGIPYNVCCQPVRVGCMPSPDGTIKNSRTIRATCYKDGIRNMVGNTIDRKTCVAEQTGETQKGSQTIYAVKDGQITIKDKTYPIKLKDGHYIIRKLTVDECKRLQTVPDWFKFPVSNTQAYKQLGNGWTVDVIVHLIKSTLNIYI